LLLNDGQRELAVFLAQLGAGPQQLIAAENLDTHHFPTISLGNLDADQFRAIICAVFCAQFCTQ